MQAAPDSRRGVIRFIARRYAEVSEKRLESQPDGGRACAQRATTTTHNEGDRLSRFHSDRRVACNGHGWGEETKENHTEATDTQQREKQVMVDTRVACDVPNARW
jgi:hypothetical protein